ncbi:MAG TPA: ABC transporter permease, partial [Fimbriimonadaceae bacterium]|nr:ABC transporter permease [Fimbriimonadaceae bacterium]
KEIIHILRDPATLVFALMIPLIQLIIFGYAIDLDVRHIGTVVVDQDHSRESRTYVEKLKATQYIDVIRYARSPGEAEDLMRSGQAKIGIVIPAGFARDYNAGRPAQVGVMIDGSDSTIAMRARSAFVVPSPTTTGIDARINVLFNPDMSTQVFMVPGLIAVILQLVTVALTAFSLVRERESGTMEQLMVSPIGKFGLMTGKIAPYAVIGFIEVAVVLLFGWLLFDVRVTGSLMLLMGLSLPFLVATLGFGLLISTMAATQAQALQLTLLFTMPSILMSGFAFPRETQPGILYLISDALPVTHYLDIVRGIIVRGAGFFDLWPSVVALLIIAGVTVLLSVFRFRKSLA